jgi:uncharacterized membrane protein
LETARIATDRPSSRRLSYAALMVAAGLTGIYAETIPNFEVLTLVVFCAGILLGARDGALVGALTMLVYSLLNPYGVVHPLVTLSQVLGEAAAGLGGAWFAAARLPERAIPVRATALALAAVMLTMFYDFITNLATGVLFGQIRATLIGGIPFALFHTATNAALFALIGTPLSAVFWQYRQRLSSSH